ncbi:hypothetical protein Q7629_11375 [Klebsiella quasipneumoniae]|nr:hypothetical protein [Klebsiella pneumoniae]SVZ14353.1 flagellar biosynthesis, cell-distal portion of basal-body rod [Klebsiella pneumoniae]
MSNLPEQASWESGIHQLEEADRAKAGPGGVLNIQANQLANRTRWLRALVESAQDYREYTFYKSESDPDGTIAGLANTPAGKMFRVAQGLSDELAFIYYLNDSGIAVALTALLGRGAIINNVREYPTLTLAQNDTVAGNILDGTKCWVTNLSDSALADEYINNGGTLSATGRKMPSQEYIDDGFTPGRVVESDNGVAIALTFAEGSRSWLESDYDGAPTEHSAKLIGQAIKIGDSPVSDNNVAIALTFAEGSRSWLESDYDGAPTEHSAKLIGQAIKIGDSPVSDNNVAIALTFAEGSRSWLESDYDGAPTEHSAKLIGQAIKIGDSPVSDNNVAIALTFAEGSRSWLESDYDGGPTGYAAEKIAEAISGSLPAVENKTIPLSTAPDGAGREYPTFKRLSAPIIQFSQQSAPTVYWPWIVDKSVWGGTGFALFYSTDHAATHDPSGIFLFEADDITGPWVNRGKVYRDDAGGWQTETPSVIYDPVNNKVLMYYQQAGVPGAIGQQQTCLATADPTDLTVWTRVGVVLDKEFLEQPGDGHCGYFRPFFYNGRLFGYSLYGGTNYSNAALWTSDDGGYTWRRDGRLIGWMQDKCRHLAATLNADPQDVLLTMYEGDVINWRGKPWWVGVSGKAQSGSVLIRHFRLVTAPLADDFASLTTRVKDITPNPATYEVQNDIDYPGNCVAAGGDVYMVYRTGGQQGNISLMRLN